MQLTVDMSDNPRIWVHRCKDMTMNIEEKSDENSRTIIIGDITITLFQEEPDEL
jgi:hypothetical protein